MSNKRLPEYNIFGEKIFSEEEKNSKSEEFQEEECKREEIHSASSHGSLKENYYIRPRIKNNNIPGHIRSPLEEKKSPEIKRTIIIIANPTMKTKNIR